MRLAQRADDSITVGSMSRSALTIDKLPRKWEQPSDHTPVIATLSD